MIKLIDSHCHLDDRSYDKDIDDVLKRAKQAGVEKCVVVGITEKSSRKAVALAEAHNEIYASVGVHPHDAKQCTEETIAVLKQLAQSPKVVAWGETGLDFNRMFSPQKIQEKWFQRQIELALEMQLPLIFHERDSQGRFLEMLKELHSAAMTGVVHCFSGSRQELSAYLDLGFYIGITGILTIKTRGAALRNLVKFVPQDRLLIETDAPYLTPAPMKNHTRRNEPAFVAAVHARLSDVLNISPEELAQRIWENTCRLFHLE